MITPTPKLSVFQEHRCEQLRDLTPPDFARLCKGQARCQPNTAASVRLGTSGTSRGLLPEERHRGGGIQRSHVREALLRDSLMC